MAYTASMEVVAGSVPSAFRPLLGRLVKGVPGVLGAIFADEEGEAVEVYLAEGVDDFYLRLVGAHWGVIMETLRREVEPRTGPARLVCIFAERFSYVLCPIAERYFVAVWADNRFPLGKELALLEDVAEAVRLEMLG